MSNNLALTFEDHNVRVVMRDGVLWWVLADVCEVSELGNTTRTAERLDQDELSNTQLVDSAGKQQDMLIVSEPGLYKLLATSRKPQARRFDRWVRHEVLPEIRRTGSYRGSLPTLDAIGNLFDKKLEPIHRGMAELREDQRQTHDNVIFLTKRVDDMAPRHYFTQNTRRSWVYIIGKFYNGFCPCCRKTMIVSEGREIKKTAHADHFNGRERVAPEDGWLVCEGCNYRLARDAQFKEHAKPHFQVFQDNRRDQFGSHTKQSSRKRKCSKTVSDHRQGSLNFSA